MVAVMPLLVALGHEVPMEAMGAVMLAKMPEILGREMTTERSWNF